MSNEQSGISLRSGTPDDADAIVRLNSDSVVVTSPMDAQNFKRLYELSSLLTIAERDQEVVGFLLGFSSGADVDGANYKWFEHRFRNFFYIDRIVIDASCRGAGLGQQFYADMTDWAKSQNLLWLAAEMNLDPPNIASLKFHRRQGFKEIGTQKLPAGKLVSMQVKRLG